MPLFRRESDAPILVDAPDPADQPATLRQTVLSANRFLNQNSGRLPGEAVVAARMLTDTLRDIIDTSDVRELDIHAVVSVKGILNDYLPTTLKAFLALDPAQVQLARPSGRTPTDSLLEQIGSLQEAAGKILVAARAQDADALMSQGNFLRTKYSGSDLDL
jgi:hypothetical protein